MRILFILVTFLFLTACANKKISGPTEDCATSYTLDDPEKEMEGILVAKVRFVFFADSVDTVSLEYVRMSLDAMNALLKSTNKQFELDEIEVVCSPNKHNMQNFVQHAFDMNKDGVFNVYIYDDVQPRMPSYKKNVRGEAADIPSRTMAIKRAYLNTSTLAHEMLHCLGLLHVHQADKTDGYTIHSGDLVCDTKSGNVEEYVTEECKYIGPEIALPDDPRKYECNLMSYISADCRNCLTEKQLDRVDFMIQNTSSLRECFGLTVSEL